MFGVRSGVFFKICQTRIVSLRGIGWGATVKSLAARWLSVCEGSPTRKRRQQAGCSLAHASGFPY